MDSFVCFSISKHSTKPNLNKTSKIIMLDLGQIKDYPPLNQPHQKPKKKKPKKHLIYQIKKKTTSNYLTKKKHKNYLIIK